MVSRFAFRIKNFLLRQKHDLLYNKVSYIGLAVENEKINF